jgi:hypothetical protein
VYVSSLQFGEKARYACGTNCILQVDARRQEQGTNLPGAHLTSEARPGYLACLSSYVNHTSFCRQSCGGIKVEKAEERQWVRFADF